ncbi:MAG: lipid-A-disaccharide synthase [Alphaproteobacteria bacterium]|nr:lipid-A-disaccharide synthase [Alphaproteobacteria bacterium]
MQNNTKVFIIAGEVSGDVLGARIMSEMPEVEFYGVGGENMTAAGLTSLFPMADLSVMGVVEVLAHARTLTRRIRQTVNEIIRIRPSVVLTIDSPGFARSVIKELRKSAAGRELIAGGLKFHHVVAPQVWAWRPGRAKKYARTFDKLYAFFDFEVPYFTKFGLDTVAVGHPIADGIIGKYNRSKKVANDEKVITFIPGSRMSEVRRLMPLMRQVAGIISRSGYRGYKFAIPTVETTSAYVAAETAKWNIPVELVSSSNRYDLYSRTYIAIAASGTVSAELAMMHVPAIIVYKMNPVTTWLVRQVINVRWVSLVNILLKRGVYPEFLGSAARAECVMDAFGQLTIPSVRERMIADLKSADKLWRRDIGGAAGIIAVGIRNAIVK